MISPCLKDSVERTWETALCMPEVRQTEQGLRKAQNVIQSSLSAIPTSFWVKTDWILILYSLTKANSLRILAITFKRQSGRPIGSCFCHTTHIFYEQPWARNQAFDSQRLDVEISPWCMYSICPNILRRSKTLNKFVVFPVKLDDPRSSLGLPAEMPTDKDTWCYSEQKGFRKTNGPTFDKEKPNG